MPKKAKILIVDDEDAVRKSLRIIASSIGAVEVVGEANSGQTALESFNLLQPDIVLHDTSIPEVDSVSKLKKYKETQSKIYVIMMSNSGDAPLVKYCIMSGANNFVLKNNDPTLIREILKQAAFDCFKLDSKTNQNAKSKTN